MRRSLSALAVAALGAALLAGCSAAPTGEQPTTSQADALCAAAAKPGAASNAVTVTGEVGSKPEVSFDALPETKELQRTVVTEGTGERLKQGDLVEIAMSLYDADTKKAVGEIGYDDANALLPQPAANLAQMLGCAEIGSRLVVAFPASEQSPAGVYVLDILGVARTKAWGEPQEPKPGLPTVTLADNGQPKIEIPEAEAPQGVTVETLKKGDGTTVGEGDEVLVQYLGVKWSDGSEFDSSWSRDQPASFNTRKVVAGFTKALEGQTVGSQVLVVMDPANGYGANKGHALEKETLVFVVDILATQHPEK